MSFQFPPRVYIEEQERNFKIPRLGKILSRRDFSTEKFIILIFIIKNELKKEQNSW